MKIYIYLSIILSETTLIQLFIIATVTKRVSQVIYDMITFL